MNFNINQFVLYKNKVYYIQKIHVFSKSIFLSPARPTIAGTKDDVKISFDDEDQLTIIEPPTFNIGESVVYVGMDLTDYNCYTNTLATISGIYKHADVYSIEIRTATNSIFLCTPFELEKITF